MATILIVDDDPLVQRAVKRAAEDAGYRVVQATDGAPALALAEQHRPDLIVLDINMPTDGRDVLKRLKEQPGTADIPVLVFTTRVDHSDRLLGLKLGADDYIEKPFSASLLVGKIGRLIEKAHEEDG